jgi:LPXTG-motif cell wall-anchored protein
MPIARRFAAAFVVVGVGVLAYAATASATGSDEQCHTIDKSKLSWQLDVEGGHATVTAKESFDGCVDLILSSYTVPDTWDKQGFNETAVPQFAFDHARGKLHSDETLQLTVALPPCGAYQIDLYFPPQIDEVTIAGHGQQLLAGALKDTARDCSTPSNTDTTTPVETTTPPEETTSPPPTTPVESTTPPATTTTSAPPTETQVVPPPSTPPTTQPNQGPPPIPVTPPAGSPPPVPPQLAETGSNSTIPLVGLGALLLTGGVVLSVVGRRRTA